MPELFLKHYGVKGQKKGKRRYQNPDGSLTALGHARYENIRKELEKTYPGWKELKTMNDKELSMVYDGLIKRNDKMDKKIAEYYPNLDIKSLSYEKKRSLYKEIQNSEKMKNEELKHSIDNGLSMITSILGGEDHFEHYNHNHDDLGRFASTPGGAKYEKKLDKIQTKIDSNNLKIEGYKKKINPRKKIKAEKLRAKSTKYEKANTKAKLKEIKGKEVNDRLAKKANKHYELNAKADLIDSKNIKLERKISELEAKNEKYQAQIDKVLQKYGYKDFEDFKKLYSNTPKHDNTIDDYLKTNKIDDKKRQYLTDLQIPNDFLHDDNYIKNIVRELSNDKYYSKDFRQNANEYLKSNEPAIERYYKANRSYSDERVIEIAYKKYMKAHGINSNYDQFINNAIGIDEKFRDSLNLGPAEKLKLQS